MQFSDKLNFLMNITQVSNKELAAALHVDRSLISLLRNGKRGLSRRPGQIRKTADFFSLHITAEFQRYALAEMMGQTAVRAAMPAEELANHLEKWLLGDTDIASTMIEGFRFAPIRLPRVPDAPVPLPSGNQTLFFYGEEGRREVMRRVSQVLRETETPGTILTVVDDNLEWLLSDYVLTRQIQSDLLRTIERGFTFYQILPPMNYINRYTESLQFWLPMYASGKMKVYYYPRLRGNLYRHSIIIVPGRCVQFSTAIGMGSSSEITMFSTDPALVDACSMQFQEHLSLCRPALVSHPDPLDGASAFQEFFSRPGDAIQMINTLSINSAPRELLEQLIRETRTPDWTPIFQMYLDEIPRFEARLQQGIYIDMSRLPTPEEVRTGQVPLVSSPFITPDHPCYTPETCIQHLKNILRLMDQYENYYFLPLREKTPPDYNLFASESGIAILARTSPPITMFEIRRPEMVTAFREHLLRKADMVGYDGFHRERVRIELKTLIRALQD